MNPLAVCYLFKEGDETNLLQLFSDELHIIKQGRAHVYHLEHPVDLYFMKKKWLLPFLAGAILFCLSLLFIFRGLFNPWISLVLLISSIFSLYVGWEGSAFLQVKSGALVHSFPVKKVSVNLKRFVSFFHNYQLARSGQEDKLLIYHIAQRQEWENQEESATYVHASLEQEGFIHCSHHDQLSRTFDKYFGDGEDLMLIAINPLELSAQLKLEGIEPGADLFPHIYGPINREAVLSAKGFKSGQQLADLLT